MRARRLAVVLGLASLVSAGCDTLRARHRAGEGVEFYKKGDFQNAAWKFEQASKLDPAIDAIHLNLGFTYLQLYTASPKSKQGHDAGGQAVQSFEEYLRRSPGSAVARNYLVQTFVDTNRYDDAVAFFKPEIERPAPSLEAIATLAQIAAKTNRFDQALAWYERRIQISPTDADGPHNLGVILWDHLHNHLDVVGPARIALADRGIAALRKAIELRPHAADGYTYLNLVYRERATAALDDAARALDLAEADKNMKTALEMVKAGGGAKPVEGTKK
ncbi:MAG: tetratricopeptide repeat protein [Myxococcales bacterium]|nr:tetratricopeptide repeat protein [Myxococcales bacterium]